MLLFWSLLLNFMENGTKISGLTDGGLLRDTDEFPVRRGSANRKILGSQVQTRVWRPEIGSLDTGLVDSLDAIPTADLAGRTRVDLYLADQFQVWLLLVTSASANGVDVIWPLDRNPASARAWVRVL